MIYKKVLLLWVCTALLCFFCLVVLSPASAYFAGNAYGVDPLAPGIDYDLDLDYLTRLAAFYPGIGLYGLYGGGGLYNDLYLIGYLYGVYGTDLSNIATSPAGLGQDLWPFYGISYNPMFGYYQPINLFGNMFSLLGLFSWW